MLIFGVSIIGAETPMTSCRNKLLVTQRSLGHSFGKNITASLPEGGRETGQSM